MQMPTFLEHHRRAVEASVEVVRTIGVADLRRATPCAEWDLAELVAHMTAQHHGFAAAARGHGADLDVWRTEPIADAVAADPGGTYADAARDVLDAFATEGLDDAAFALPEFGADVTVPGALAMGFHFVDYVVHGWDVAASLGQTYSLPADVAAAALPIALGVPDGEMRDAGNSPFARAVAPGDTDDDLARILRHLGRDPDGA